MSDWRDNMEPFDADARRPWVNDPTQEPPLPNPKLDPALAQRLRGLASDPALTSLLVQAGVRRHHTTVRDGLRAIADHLGRDA